MLTIRKKGPFMAALVQERPAAHRGGEPAPEPTTDALRNGAAALGVPLTDAQIRQFQRYHAELTAWNRRANLTAITDWNAAVTLHFLDSLSVAAAIPDETLAAGALLDVGSGGGFPGIPLRIAYPALRLTLLDATAKKTAFLSHICRALALPGVSVLTGRAETLARDPDLRERFDAVAARAVAETAALAELTLPFVRVGGVALLQKKADIQDELARAQNAVAALGGSLKAATPVSLPNLNEPRAIVALEKTSPTPPQYPRRPGIPAKRPLR